MKAIVDLTEKMSAWAALISRTSHGCAGLILVMADDASKTVSHYLSNEQRLEDAVEHYFGEYASAPYLLRVAEDPTQDNPKFFRTVKSAEQWFKKMVEMIDEGSWSADKPLGRPALAFWIFPECFPEQDPVEKYQMMERQFPGSTQQ